MNRIVTLVASCLVLAVTAAAGVIQAQGAKDEKKVQQVKQTVDDNGNYVVTPSTVTKGVPVKMDVDLGTVKGCARTVVIQAANVKKTVKEGETTIEFTPTKTGKIDVVCGMNMVKGSFNVVEPK